VVVRNQYTPAASHWFSSLMLLVKYVGVLSCGDGGKVLGGGQLVEVTSTVGIYI
jgi:hypothetical protein